MPIRLDERLTAVAELAAGAKVLCDVGCDHGKLACYAVQTGRAESALATDISAPSLRKAAELAEDTGVYDRVETRLGDGLDPVADGEADTVVIAGMGGDLIARILERAHAQGKTFPRLVLSPNTHPERVRATLAGTGYALTADMRVLCAGKAYTVIAAERGEETLGELQLLFGKFFATDEAFRAEAGREAEELGRTLAAHPEAAGLKEKKALLERALKECGI